MSKVRKEIIAYDILLKQHIDKKDFVKISRTFKEKDGSISGFILSISKDFLLIQIADEFSLNGYAIIRKDNFDSLRCNQYDKTQKKIYKAEGILEREYGIDKSISLESWQDVLKALRQQTIM